MEPRLRHAFLCLCLAALAAPAGAVAGSLPAAPPGSGEGASFSTAARTAVNPGCRSRNVIAFKTPERPRSKVRHAGRIRCENVRVNIRCSARLLQGGERISTIRSRGANRCRVGTRFAESPGRYPQGTRFRQRYRYTLTLKRKGQRWSGTTQDCPRRSNNRRTLTCRGSHVAVAPNRSVDTIRS